MSKEDVDKIIEDALGVIDDTPKETQELVVKKETPIVPIPRRSPCWKPLPEGILDLAKESDHPRAYEVAGNMIKNVADVTEKLALLQEKMQKLKEVPNKAPKNVTNALFVGSTAELQKMLKKKKDD